MLPQKPIDLLKTHIKYVQYKFKKREFINDSGKKVYGLQIELSQYQADPKLLNFDMKQYDIRKYFEKCVQNPVTQLRNPKADDDDNLILLMQEVQKSCRYFGSFEIAYQLISFFMVLLMAICNFIVLYNDQDIYADRVIDSKVVMLILMFSVRLAYSLSVKRLFLYLSYVLACTIVVIDVLLLQLVEISDQSLKFILIFVLEMITTIAYSAIIIWTATQQEMNIQYIRVLLGYKYEQFLN